MHNLFKCLSLYLLETNPIILNYRLRELSSALSEHSEDPSWSPLGPPRQPSDLVPHEDAALVRMRKASPRDGVGGERDRRPNQRDLLAAHLVPAMPSLSALLPAQHGPLQGQITWSAGECGQTGLAPHEDYVNQFEVSRGTVIVPVSEHWSCSSPRESGWKSAVKQNCILY